MGPLSVKVVDDVQGFTALEHEWRELLQSSSSDSPFLTWEWLHAWWARFGRPGILQLIVVRSGELLVAIAPLRLTVPRVRLFQRLEFLGTGEAGSDYLDLIVRRGHEAEALRSIADCLQARKLTVRLTHLPPASLAAQLARQLADRAWTTTSSDDGVCPIVDLRGHTFDSFLATLGASHRANVRRRLRAIERQFAVRFDQITGSDERREMLGALHAFHAGRYAERGGSTAFSTPAVRAFHEAATQEALERGWLRMYALRLDGRLAAVMYGFNYGSRFYFYQHGYDDRFSSLSVGLVLMALTLRTAISDGALEFDMLWGTEPYKSLWTHEMRRLQRVDLFPLRLSEMVHRHATDARRGIAQLARRVLSHGSPGAARVT
jgi:CelD/BcsL family acetyltransferase involved in cellulose biosynthesis